MKKTKRVILGLTACCTVLCAAAGLTACHEHAWGDGEVTTAARCGQAGEKTFTCECGEARKEEIPALEHAWDNGETETPATCTQEGVKKFKCTRDGCTQTKEEAIGKTAHSMGEWVITEPEADKAGKAVKTCSMAGCTEKKEETLPALTDKAYAVEGDTATCSSAGTATYKITVNGTPFEFVAATPKKAHEEEWAVTKNPSIALPGTATKFCANCTHDFKTTVELPVLTSDNAGSGKFYSSVTQKPTCTDNGKITYTVSQAKLQELFGGATLKSFEITEDNDLQATGHSYELEKNAKQATKRCKNSGCHDTQIITWEKDFPAGGAARDKAVKIESGKYNWVLTEQCQLWYTFNVTKSGLYKLMFTYLEKPALKSNVATFCFSRADIVNDNGTSSMVINRNTVGAAYQEKVVLTYFEEGGFIANRYAPESLVMNFTPEDVGKKVVLQLQLNVADKLDCVIEVDIPEDNTPAPLPKLAFGANDYTFEANAVTNFEFTSATAKQYSVSASDGVSVGLERADGTYADLISDDGEVVNFEMAAGETVTLFVISSSSGQKTVTIGDAVEEGALTLHKGEKLPVSTRYRDVVVFIVGDDYEEGQYNLVLSGGTAFGTCNFYMTVNDTDDWNQMTKGLYVFPQSNPTVGTGIMEGFTRYEGHNVTGTFKAGDKIALAHYNMSSAAQFEVELVSVA